MQRKEFYSMDFNQAMKWAWCNLPNVYTREDLKRMAVKEIKDNNIGMAIHLLTALDEDFNGYNEYYRYNYLDGTSSTPKAIRELRDIDDLIKFEKPRMFEVWFEDGYGTPFFDSEYETLEEAEERQVNMIKLFNLHSFIKTTKKNYM